MKILLTKPYDILDGPHGADQCRKCTFTLWSGLEQACSDHYTDIKMVNGGSAAVAQYYKTRSVHQYDLYIIHHIAHNSIDMMDYKQAYYPNLFYLDNGGYSGFSNLAKEDFIDREVTDSVITKFCNKHIYPHINSTKYEHKNTKGVETNLPSEFIFVALQVATDSVMNLKTRDSKYMLRMAATVGHNMGLPVVVKFHPMSTDISEIATYINKLNRSGARIYKSEADVRELLKGSKATFVINSGVGFESLIHGIPVFTYGKCDYNAIAHYNLTDTKAMEKIISEGIDKKEYDRFLYSWWQQIIDVNIPGYEKRIKYKIEQKLLKDK